MWLGRPGLMLSYLGTKVGAFFGADKPAWSLLRDIVTTVSFARFDDQKKSAPEFSTSSATQVMGIAAAWLTS